MSDRVEAPVVDERKLARQKEVLLAYVQEQGALIPDSRYRYLGHEFVSRSDEPTKVVLYLGLSGSHADFEFTLEELQLFQARRFPTPATPTTPATPASSSHLDGRPVPATPSPVNAAPQINWASNREALFSRVSDLEAEARRYVSMQVTDGRRQMHCRCIAGSTAAMHLCDHLQFVYATGWERDKLLDESGSGSLRQIRLPIGMGEVYLDLEATILEDRERPAGKWRTGYVKISDPDGNGVETFLRKLAHIISPFPDEVDHVILAPGDGTIKAIRYIEGLLRGTEQYQQLCALSPTGAGRDGFQQANMVCSRNHTGESGRRLVSQFIAGLRHGNAHRESWMVACAYTVFMSGLCLPCHKATSAAANVPAF